jgi:glyoxylase-like metal-dependent hydrolase (beta-lactamase superfamily II)
MHITQVAEHIYLIDLETVGIKNSFASYVLKGKKAAIVETGPTSSIPNLISGLKELSVKPEDVTYVAVTHVHLDHGGGVGTLLKYLPKAKVIVHQRGAPHLVNPEKLWQQSKVVIGAITEMYGKPEPVPEERIIAAVDGMIIDVGNGVKLKIAETPGHASHHLSYYEPSSEGIFTGDAAGLYIEKFDVTVPTTPSPFRMDIALASLNKLMDLKPKVLYYTHFGKASDAVEKLRSYGAQLELWASIAKRGLENGESLDAISQKILEEDEALKKAEGYVRAHSILRTTMRRESVRGILEFVQKFG